MQIKKTVTNNAQYIVALQHKLITGQVKYKDPHNSYKSLTKNHCLLHTADERMPILNKSLCYRHLH